MLGMQNYYGNKSNLLFGKEIDNGIFMGIRKGKRLDNK